MCRSYLTQWGGNININNMLSKIKNWIEKIKQYWKELKAKQEIYEFFDSMEKEAKERWKKVKK